MKEIGLVVSTSGERAQVQVKRKAQCDKCGMCIFPKGADTIDFDCINKVDAKIGDTVEIQKEEKNKILSYILIFLVPLLLIGASALVGLLLIKIDYWVLILSAITLTVWFILLSVIDKAVKKSGKLSPVILNVINGQDIVKDGIVDRVEDETVK